MTHKATLEETVEIICCSLCGLPIEAGKGTVLVNSGLRHADCGYKGPDFNTEANLHPDVVAERWASEQEDHPDPDVCEHGRSFDEICVLCCPEDDDGSETGEDWS